MNRIILLSLLLSGHICPNPLLSRGAYFLGTHVQTNSAVLAGYITTINSIQDLDALKSIRRSIPYGTIILHPATPAIGYAAGTALKAAGITSKYPQATTKDAK